MYTSNKGLDNIAEIERKMEQKKREAQRAKQGDGGDEADDESESDSFFESERDDEGDGDGPQRGKKKKRSWGDVILDPNTYWLTFVPHERSLSLSLNTHTHTHTHTHTCYIMLYYGHFLYLVRQAAEPSDRFSVVICLVTHLVRQAAEPSGVVPAASDVLSADCGRMWDAGACRHC
jgi:hypothetical protein